MGIALWLSCGLAAFALARFVPAAARRPWLAELSTSLFVSLALGGMATALDFGGWREPDWRAGLFSFLGAFAAIGMFRALRSAS